MNKRIKELEDQCWEDTGENEYYFNRDKFAELLIRKCAQIVNDNDCEGSIVGDGMLFEHFGVKE